MSLYDCTANILLLLLCMLARCGEGEGLLWCVAENGAALLEEAHITALGHSQATTLTLAVATFAHCHKVSIDEHEKCNFFKKKY